MVNVLNSEPNIIKTEPNILKKLGSANGSQSSEPTFLKRLKFPPAELKFLSSLSKEKGYNPAIGGFQPLAFKFLENSKNGTQQSGFKNGTQQPEFKNAYPRNGF